MYTGNSVIFGKVLNVFSGYRLHSDNIHNSVQVILYRKYWDRAKICTK